MIKKRTSRPTGDERIEPVSNDDKIPTEEEVMARPGTREVLRVFHGWKMDESETK